MIEPPPGNHPSLGGLRALPGPHALFEVLHRVTVRPEVSVAFGGALSDEVDLVPHPGLDAANFGMLLTGTELGRVHPGAAMPLRAVDMQGRDTTERYFAVQPDGALVVTQAVTQAMMTTAALQARRDCLTYLTRRRAGAPDAGLAAGRRSRLSPPPLRGPPSLAAPFRALSRPTGRVRCQRRGVQAAPVAGRRAHPAAVRLMEG